MISTNKWLQELSM